MKKDILAIVAAVLIIIVLIGGVEIQSVDEYYLSHIDDIKPDSETVFLSIRCDSIFDNYDKLDASLKNGDYIPQNGIILEKTEYVLRDGDTVYDVLDRVLRYNKIQAEYRGSKKTAPGWMYRVNGVFPSQSCAEYTLSDGDVIEFVYSCDLGHDIGENGGYGNE